MKSPTAELRNDRVRLTPLRVENLYTHFRWHRAFHIPYFEFGACGAFEVLSFERFRAQFMRLHVGGRPVARGFEAHRLDGPLLGVARLDQIDPAARSCRVGVAVPDPALHGLGYGRSILDLLLHTAFDEMRLHRVRAAVPPRAAAWQHLLELGGFRQTATPVGEEVWVLTEPQYRDRTVAHGDAVPRFAVPALAGGLR